MAAALKPAGYPLTSPNNILVLGSDRRPKGSKEPGANTSGPSRSDTIMLIRTGGGHSARLSIPRDTVVEIPGHGLNKINAAYAFGGPALSIRVVEELVHIPINHLVEVNFENFPQLIDAMGGVDYTGGCIVANLDGGTRNGGYTLRLSKGTHRLNGRQALALARTRENLCAPNETDIQREEHQQALFNDMKSRLASFSSFVRMPLIAWNAPPAIISDMSGTTLLGLFGALAIGGTPPPTCSSPPARSPCPTARTASPSQKASGAPPPPVSWRGDYFAAATGLESVFFSGLGPDSPFLASPLEPESLDDDEESEEPESLDPALPDPESPEDELSVEAAFSRWRLRVP